MKYMLMMHAPANVAESLSKWSPADFKAHIEFMHTLNAELVKSGEFVLAEGLDMPHTAKTVSAKQAGKPLVTDGPFTESKEFLAGFWIVKVSSEQRACEIAARASTAPGPGGAPMGIPIEVRRVGEAPEV
jgi:hypothetical protein